MCCSACYFSPCRIYFICQKSSPRFLLFFFSVISILFSLKLWNKKCRSTCPFNRKQAFISLSSLALGKSLMLCMCTRSTMRSFARANDAKIVRSRDAQCNTDRGITLTPTTEDTNFHRRQGFFHSQLELDWMTSSDHRNRKFSKHIFFNSCYIQGS